MTLALDHFWLSGWGPAGVAGPATTSGGIATQTLFFRPLSQHRLTLSGATDGSGVPYTNAVQGATPAADGIVTVTDYATGAVIGGISSAPMLYSAFNQWQYDLAAAIFTISARGGLHAVVTAQLVDHVNHATVLHTEQIELLPGPVATGIFKPLSPNRLTLSGIYTLDGVAYDNTNSVGRLTIMHREYGTVYVNAASMTWSGAGWVDDPLPSIYDPSLPLRTLAQYYALDGVTLLETEVLDLYPEAA